MKILVIGSGGREHALVWKIAQSPKVTKIYCAPGNAGTSQIAENINIAAEDIIALKEFAITNHIDLTVVGPEIPLVAGIVDEFTSANLKVFGPEAKAANLEGSKIFAKTIMKKYNIPTADFLSFTEEEEAKKFLKKVGAPVVVKADGLAYGKGVIICNTEQEAYKAITRILREKEFGDAGNQIIIEELLYGEEASILCFADGKTIIPMASSQDHKRIFDNDSGPNTGGMGAYSPAPIITKDLLDQIHREILQPTISGMNAEGHPFKGVLYVGIMLTKDGPKVLEYNARFGDPETQCILPRLKNDIIEVFEHVIGSCLDKITLNWDNRAAVCVVLASGGYPGTYKKGYEIKGLEEIKDMEDVVVFHAGTKLGRKEQESISDTFLTNGGRVLNIVGLGDGIKKAITHAYKAVKLIHFDNLHYRKDVGEKALKWIS